MIPQEIIARKRDGHVLNRDEIFAFVEGVVSGDFRDYQSSSLLMAISLNGMSAEETMHLTDAMTHSGQVLDLSEMTRPRLDKHSTGGVGDKVSLVLAPLAAACGLCVPMMSGRGLGHTGGTLDKLEAIPGFQVDLSEAAYREQLQQLHVAMISQSAAIAPADRKLYALRDVTATVESIPLICASILSKKLAEGIDGLVLDVKFGRGAFMANLEEARELAQALVRISRSMGKSTSALITRMDVPLGCAVGNALEVREALDCLRGSGPEDLMEVTYALTAEMLRLGRVVDSAQEARALMERQIESGAALNVFRKMVTAQHGDASVVDEPERLPRASQCLSMRYEGADSVSLAGLDARIVGEAARVLGAGRSHAEAPVDPAVGFVFQKKPGDTIAPNDVLVQVHANDGEKVKEAMGRLETAFEYSTGPVEPPALIVDQI